MRTILVPLDETELAERAVPVAGALAAATGAEVVVLTVDELHESRGESTEYLDSQRARLPEGVASRILVVHAEADAAEVVAEQAMAVPDAVVVLSTRAHTGLGALLFGSTAEGILRRVTVPVVLVGPRCDASRMAVGGGQVLVAVDGGALDDVVVGTADRWSMATGSALEVVHCRVVTAFEGVVGVDGDPDLAERVAGRLRTGDRQVTATTVEAASPESAILDVAERSAASAIVVGSRRPGRWEGALLGSTATALAHRAHCPVVAIGAPLDT